MSISTNPTDYVYVPLRADLYAELIRRSGRSDVSVYVENQVQDFLEATKSDPSIWSAEYIERQAQDTDQEFITKYGNPSRGYQWQSLFLPNGSQVRMTYRGEAHYAFIQHERLRFGSHDMSPSEFARSVANNTNRNAWRDIYVQFPGEADWKFADDLRRQGK
ncbi:MULTISPECIES: hypothetical protein [unclassified Phaeobacter]|uniref:hypothetical protein n=1 Tax=unclassified Phaeobacter TaxID=2621772 RepID=UPI003A865A5E